MLYKINIDSNYLLNTSKEALPLALKQNRSPHWHYSYSCTTAHLMHTFCPWHNTRLSGALAEDIKPHIIISSSYSLPELTDHTRETPSVPSSNLDTRYWPPRQSTGLLGSRGLPAGTVFGRLWFGRFFLWGLGPSVDVRVFGGQALLLLVFLCRI